MTSQDSPTRVAGMPRTSTLPASAPAADPADPVAPQKLRDLRAARDEDGD